MALSFLVGVLLSLYSSSVAHAQESRVKITSLRVVKSEASVAGESQPFEDSISIAAERINRSLVDLYRLKQWVDYRKGNVLASDLPEGVALITLAEAKEQMESAYALLQSALVSMDPSGALLELAERYWRSVESVLNSPNAEYTIPVVDLSGVGNQTLEVIRSVMNKITAFDEMKDLHVIVELRPENRELRTAFALTLFLPIEALFVVKKHCLLEFDLQG